MTSTRLLHVITTLDRGGAEMHLLSLVGNLPSDRYQVTVAYLKGPGQLTTEFEAAGARVVRFGMWGPADPILVLRLARWIRSERFEIVHTHLFKADVHAALAARLGGAPGLVCSKHNQDQYLDRKVFRRLGRAVGRLPDRTIVISRAVERFMSDRGCADPDRTRLVYYGIDLEAFDRAAAGETVRPEIGIDPDAIAAVCVARLYPQKGYPHLLEAFARVAPELPEARLVVVGDGPDRSALEAQVDRLDLKEAVRFTGQRDDIPRVLASMDLFVLPSLWEGFGLVFLEAAAARLATIGSQVGPIPEVVAEGETGLLVPPADPDALAEALRDLLTDASKRKRLGEAGRQRAASRFCLNRMVTETEEVYDEVIGHLEPGPDRP